MHTTSRICVILGIASVLGWTQAATAQATLTRAEKALIKLFDGSLTLTVSTNKDVIDRSSLPAVAMKASKGEFLETFGPNKGKVFTRTIKNTRTYPKTWPKSPVGTITETIPGDVVLYEMLDVERGLVAPLGLDLHQSVQVAYEPGELMVPLGPNVKPYEMKLQVYNLTDPKKVTHTGSLKVSASDRGQWTVVVPGGTFECVLYAIAYDGKVGPANVTDTALVFIDPHEGIVAKVTRSKVSAFLVYNQDDRFAYVKAKSQ